MVSRIYPKFHGEVHSNEYYNVCFDGEVHSDEYFYV